MFRVINFLLCLVPMTLLATDLFFGRSGPDVVSYIMHETGDATFLMLILALSMSPLRHATGLKIFLQLRRQIGLFTFFYASLHAVSYLYFYIDFGWIYLKLEILKRPYIILGFLCWFLLLPLAITSTHYHQKMFGAYWNVLHKLIYPASIFACLHVYLQMRSDFTKAIIFSAVVLFLLAWRIRRRVFFGRILVVKK